MLTLELYKLQAKQTGHKGLMIFLKTILKIKLFFFKVESDLNSECKRCHRDNIPYRYHIT